MHNKYNVDRGRKRKKAPQLAVYRKLIQAAMHLPTAAATAIDVRPRPWPLPSDRKKGRVRVRPAVRPLVSPTWIAFVRTLATSMAR